LRRIGRRGPPPIPHEHEGPVTVHSIREARRRLKILLADDNPVSQQLTARILEKRGHSVVVVGTGRQAVEALERNEFHLILMGVQMPELDGLEATAAIRARERTLGTRIPIIALTAHAMTGDKERCLAAGMDGYLSKPLRTHELMGAIEGLTATQLEDPLVQPEKGDWAKPQSAVDHAEMLAVVEGDRSLLHELAQIFLTDTPPLMAALSDAMARRDSSQVASLAHRIKGSAANFRARAAAAAAQAIEEPARRGDLHNVETAWAELERRVDDMMESLRSLEP
jgi:two-component system sensor histidine kinase/response regulator